MGAILKRELSSYFNSAIAYVVLAAYFFFSGVFFYNYCIVYNSASLSYVYGNMLLQMKSIRKQIRRSLLHL